VQVTLRRQMNLWVVEPLRKGPIGVNNCHISPRSITKSNQPAPEGGGGELVVEELVIVGEVVIVLVGGGVVVVSGVLVVGCDGVVTVGAELGWSGTTEAGRGFSPEPGLVRTMLPIVVPRPPDSDSPRAHSRPVINARPRANAITALAASGAQRGPRSATVACMRW
jgi:hypothetical protein